MPETIPEVVIAAIAGMLLLQVPPGVALASEVAEPTHTTSVPVIALTDATFIVVDVLHPAGSV
jgi:hypothetical protein